MPSSSSSLRAPCLRSWMPRAYVSAVVFVHMARWPSILHALIGSNRFNSALIRYSLLYRFAIIPLGWINANRYCHMWHKWVLLLNRVLSESHWEGKSLGNKNQFDITSRRVAVCLPVCLPSFAYNLIRFHRTWFFLALSLITCDCDSWNNESSGQIQWKILLFLFISFALVLNGFIVVAEHHCHFH